MSNEEVKLESVNVEPVVEAKPLPIEGSENYASVNSAVLADMAPVTIKENTERSEEQINMDKYLEKYEFSQYFPGLEERCIELSRQGIKPEPDVNTGALRGDVLHEAGMELLSAIKKEIFNAKPQWEKDWIKEGRISGAKLEDEPFLDDGVTPADGRPPLTVEYLRSIGYDIDIS
jgi:hypothetical protein